MFRKLKRKFITIQMGIVFSLLSLFFAGAIFSVYREINNYSNDTLRKISNLDFLTPLPPREISKDNIPKFLPFVDMITDESGIIIEIKDSEKALERALEMGITKNRGDEFRQNFYSRFNVPIDESLDLEKYINLLEKVKSENRDDGIVKIQGRHYKYRVEERRVILLDITLGMEIIQKILWRFFKISIPILLIIYGICYKLADVWIKPVEESFEKQREFIANASHELRTPLTSISANLDILSHNLGEKSFELMANSKEEKKFLNNGNRDENIKWVSNIKIESERMRKLIDELLYFTRLELSLERENFQKINLSKILERYILSKEALFFEKKLKVERDIAPNLEMLGDAGEIEKLLGILIDNGIKYSSETLKSSKVLKMSLKKNGDKNEFRIYNSGEGIAPEEMDKIWDRFYRGDRSRKYTGGFGLGLPIGKKITENHKGTLEVVSRVGEYTEFVLRLPSR